MVDSATKTVTIEVTKTINDELYGTSKEFEIPRTLDGYMDMDGGTDFVFELCQEAFSERLRLQLVRDLTTKVTGKAERKKAAKQIKLD